MKEQLLITEKTGRGAMTKKYLFLVIGIGIWMGLQAQPATRIRQLAYGDSARLVSVFKDLHQHPELGFGELRSSAIVASALKELGYEVLTNIGKTGVVGILYNGEGPVAMYRADMDANAVKEETGLSYASTQTAVKDDGTEVPVMHACGHDAHMTWMLGVARIMMHLKTEWKGTLVFIAQPAEEPLLGAKAMAADPVFREKVPIPDYLLGLHTWPIALGQVINGFGVRNSGSDQLDVTFYGVGGHGSTPELTKDPVVMLSNAVLQYQTIISRNIAAQETGVLTVGAIHAGGDNNVIPASGVAKLNLRWFKELTRNTLLSRIEAINKGIAVANGLPPELYPTINMKSSTIPLVNDTGLTKRINKALTAVLTPQNIITDLPAFMGSEDFTYLALDRNRTACSYSFVGVAHPDDVASAAAEGKKHPYGIHTGVYKVDLAAIPLGTMIGAVGLFELLRKPVRR